MPRYQNPGPPDYQAYMSPRGLEPPGNPADPDSPNYARGGHGIFGEPRVLTADSWLMLQIYFFFCYATKLLFLCYGIKVKTTD